MGASARATPIISRICLVGRSEGLHCLRWPDFRWSQLVNRMKETWKPMVLPDELPLRWLLSHRFHLDPAWLISCSWAGWPASPDPHIGHLRWWHKWPGYTSYDGAESGDPAYLWFLQHSLHLADPVEWERNIHNYISYYVYSLHRSFSYKELVQSTGRWLNFETGLLHSKMNVSLQLIVRKGRSLAK